MAEDYKINVDINSNGIDDAEEDFLALGKSIDKARQELDAMREANVQNTKEFKTAKDQLDKMEKSFKDLNKEMKGVDASFEEVYGEVKPLTTALGEAEDRLYQLALAGDTTSKEYQQLLEKVTRYRKVQIETDQIVDASAVRFSQKLGGAIQGVASSYAIAQGAMAIFGSESETLERQLLKVNAAMALSQGIAGLNEARKSFQALGRDAIASINGMNKALKLSLLGAFVAVIISAAVYWDDLKNAISGTNDMQEEYNEIAERTSSKLTEIYTETAKMESIFALAKKGVIKKEDALKAYNNTLGKSFGKAKDLNEAEALFIQKTPDYIEAATLRAEAEELIKMAAQKRLEASQETYLMEKGNLDQMTEMVGVYWNSFTKGTTVVEEYGKIANKSLGITGRQEAEKLMDQANNLLIEADELLRKSNINGVGFSFFKNYFNSTETKKILDDTTKTINKLIDIENDIIDIEFTNLEKLFGKTLESAIIRLDEAYIRDLQKYDDMLENKRISTDQHEQVIDELEIRYHQNRNLLRQEFSLKGLETLNIELDMEQTKADKTLDIYTLMYGGLNTMAKKNAKDQTEIDKQVMAARLEIAHAGLGAIGDLVNGLAADNEKSQRRAFNVNKAVGIAQAIISTAQGVTKALAETTDITPTQSLRFANAAVVAISGAAQVATIAKQQFQVSGGGGSADFNIPSGGSESAGASPSFNVVGSAGLAQLAQLQMQPTQAYVVSGDITTAQSLDRNKIENATI